MQADRMRRIGALFREVHVAFMELGVEFRSELERDLEEPEPAEEEGRWSLVDGPDYTELRRKVRRLELATVGDAKRAASSGEATHETRLGFLDRGLDRLRERFNELEERAAGLNHLESRIVELESRLGLVTEEAVPEIRVRVDALRTQAAGLSHLEARIRELELAGERDGYGGLESRLQAAEERIVGLEGDNQVQNLREHLTHRCQGFDRHIAEGSDTAHKGELTASAGSAPVGIK